MKETIKNIARDMAKRNGLINLDRVELCAAAGIAVGSFHIATGCTFTDLISELKREGLGGNTHKANKYRANPELRREHILDAAVKIAKNIGYTNVTRNAIAESAGISTGLVTNYLGTLPAMQRTLMRYAIKNSIVEIVAQGLANKDKHARKATPELKERAAQFIATS